MTEENNKTDHIGNIIVFILFGLLFYAGFLSYKSIDWKVLENLEKDPLILPSPIPTLVSTQSAQITPSTPATTSTKTNTTTK